MKTFSKVPFLLAVSLGTPFSSEALSLAKSSCCSLCSFSSFQVNVVYCCFKGKEV